MSGATVFSLLLQRKLDDAKVQFLGLTDLNDPVVALLSAYMLETAGMNDNDALAVKDEMRQNLKSPLLQGYSA